MRNKKLKIISISLCILAALIFLHAKLWHPKQNTEITEEIKPVVGNIENIISTTGTVLPKNRLEVKPPVNGRIVEMLAKEGEVVKTGQILAWMSSTERAALLDAARGQSDESLKYWKETYKAIPLISPIDGEVIVSDTQPGQTVTASDAIVVLSDRLIVRAQVDETDIGKIKPDNKAVISLEAYPDTKIRASVEHIYYESETVNNVTVYKDDLMPEEVPSFFRSGMNATIDFIEQSRSGALLLPVDAVLNEKDGNYVLVKRNKDKKPVKTAVTLGMSDDKNIEILSGLTQDGKVVIKTQKYSLPTSTTGTNPFMPSRKKR